MKTSIALHNNGLKSAWSAAVACGLAFGIQTTHATVATNFTIVNHATSQPLSLYDYQGSVILLEFWAYWAGPCQRAALDIETSITQYYRNAGGNSNGVPVQVISINIDCSSLTSENSFIQTYGLELVGDDCSWVAYNQFDHGGIPQFAVINGTTNSLNCTPWQILTEPTGYGTNNTVPSLKSYIDSVQVSPTTTNPPSITGQPQAVTVNAHANASFNVTATGTMPLNYQWSLNGTKISGGTASSLTISNVTQQASGAYSVVISNTFGSAISSNAMLSMYPYLYRPFLGAVGYWGKETLLSVEAWGTGLLTCQWFKDGVPIFDATNQTLTLLSIQATNAGLYSIVVSSALGSVTNAPAEVVVEPAGVSLGFSPTVKIDGVTGYSYIIERTTDLTNTNSWVTLTNLTLTEPVQIWVDTSVNASSPFYSKYFYRILPGQ